MHRLAFQNRCCIDIDQERRQLCIAKRSGPIGHRSTAGRWHRWRNRSPRGRVQYAPAQAQRTVIGRRRQDILPNRHNAHRLCFRYRSMGTPNLQVRRIGSLIPRAHRSERPRDTDPARLFPDTERNQAVGPESRATHVTEMVGLAPGQPIFPSFHRYQTGNPMDAVLAQQAAMIGCAKRRIKWSPCGFELAQGRSRKSQELRSRALVDYRNADSFQATSEIYAKF